MIQSKGMQSHQREDTLLKASSADNYSTVGKDLPYMSKNEFKK